MPEPAGVLKLKVRDKPFVRMLNGYELYINIIFIFIMNMIFIYNSLPYYRVSWNQNGRSTKLYGPVQDC